MTNHSIDEIAKKLQPLDLPPLTEKPLVSVLVANYNYARYVGEAIESVLSQTYQNFEVIVCDDGSTDNSLEVIERYAQRDTRVRLIARENGGVATALNAAYAASKGEVVCLLDSDDTFLPEKFAEVVRAFHKFSRAGVCHHQLQKVDETVGRALSPYPVVFAEGWMAVDALRGGGLAKSLPIRHFPSTSGLCWRREVLDVLFPLPPVFLSLDAYLFQASQFITEVCAVRRALGIYRFHGADCQSGGARFTAGSLRRNVRIITDNTTLLQQFLRARYGEALASHLRMEDNNLYCYHVAVLHVLDGERQGADGDGREQLAKIVGRIQPLSQRVLVRFFLTLPPWASRRLLQFCAGTSQRDAAVKRTIRWFLRV